MDLAFGWARLRHSSRAFGGPALCMVERTAFCKETFLHIQSALPYTEGSDLETLSDPSAAPLLDSAQDIEQFIERGNRTESGRKSACRE